MIWIMPRVLTAQWRSGDAAFNLRRLAAQCDGEGGWITTEVFKRSPPPPYADQYHSERYSFVYPDALFVCRPAGSCHSGNSDLDSAPVAH
jgi:hypothetical protein